MTREHSKGFVTLEAALGFLILLPAVYLGLGIADYMLTSREIERIALSGAYDNSLKPMYSASGDQGLYVRGSVSTHRSDSTAQQFTEMARALRSELLNALREIGLCTTSDCSSTRYFLEIRFTALNIDGDRGLPCGATTCEPGQFKRALLTNYAEWSLPAFSVAPSDEPAMRANSYFRAFGDLPGEHTELITPIQNLYSRLMQQGQNEFYNALPTANFGSGQRQYYGVSNENMYKNGGTIAETVFKKNFLPQTSIIGVLVKVDVGATFGGRVMRLLSSLQNGQPPDSYILTYQRFFSPRKQL